MRKWLTGVCAAAAVLAMTGIAAAETVKVGVIGVFSGGFARWGEQFKQAIEVYQKHNGKTVNGHTIEVVYRDAGGPDPAKSRQLAEELILREKIQFLAGFAFTPNALAVAQLVTESKTPTVIFNAATAVVTRRSPYFVRVSFTLPQDTAPLAEWAPKNGIKKVVTVVSDYAPGHDAEATFLKVFKANGGEVLESIRIPLATTDFAPFFERILQQKPDAIFLFGPGGPASVVDDQHLGVAAEAGRHPAHHHQRDAGNRPAAHRQGGARRHRLLALHRDRRQSAQQAPARRSRRHVRHRPHPRHRDGLGL